MISLMAFLIRTGITRLSSDVCDESLSLQKEYLSDDEAEMFCAVFYRSTLTKNMLQEMKVVDKIALQVEGQGIPDIPLLFFISDGTEVGTDNWRSLLAFYIDAAPQGQSHLLDVGHYIHNHEPELIGTLSHKFIQDVLQDLK